MSCERKRKEKATTSPSSALLLLLLITLTVLGPCEGKQAGAGGLHRGCKLEGLHPLLIVTYKNITISVDKITVPHGERVTVRCKELGRYKLIGDSLLHCRNATWNGELPSCVATTAISNYTGWAISARERDWKYRLSIYYAKTQDSGVYTCSTPRGLSNSIRVHVVDVHCPVLRAPPPPPLIAKIDGSRMGHGASFQCPAGYRLEGAPAITCQYNGKWSAGVPRCETIECPPMDAPEDSWLQLLEHNNTFGGRAVFACLWGHKLVGAQSVDCGADGTWSGATPSCSEITCPSPLVPRSGRILEQSQRPVSNRNQQQQQQHHHLRQQRQQAHRGRAYKAGALVKFACLPGHQLIGEAAIICTENGTWSHESPVCKVRCPYPGDPPHGRIAPLKFWYKPGDNIQVTCSPGYVSPLEPVRKPTCRENGIWSAPPPPCRSYRDV